MSIAIKKNKNISSDGSFCGKSIAVLLFFLLIIKQWAIYFTYGGQTIGGLFSQILLFLSFFGSDLMVVGLVLFLIFLGLSAKNTFLKILINIINIVVTLIFFIDVITIFFFQSRLSLADIYGFFSYSLSGYFSLYTLLSFVFFVVLSFLAWIISQKFLKQWKKTSYWLYISVIFLLINVLITGINLLTKNKESFANNILLLNGWPLGSDAYSNIKNSGLEEYEDYFTGVSGLGNSPNIILLFAESLSAVDSKRSGGLYDNLPLFDKIQADGITFTNFIANGCTSETAHIALLRGVEPWEYPLIDSNTTYDSYVANGESLPIFMKNQGYSTTFVSSVTLDFLNQRDFISGLQFQNVVGEESFKKEKKYVFDAAPDHILYRKVVQLASGYSLSKKPYFLTVQNVSAHRPYDTPYGDSTQQMFSYVDKSLYTFYQDLKDIGFFKNGVLVIVSDHRKMEPISKEEFEKFGLSAKSRVVATIVGKGVHKNIVNDNITQHTDMYNSLKYFVGGDSLSVSTLFNDAFSFHSNRDWGVRYCRYADKVYVRVNKNGLSSVITNNKEDKPIIDYIQAYKGFQAEKLLGLSGMIDYDTPKISLSGDGIILVAHGGGPYNKWSLNTLSSAIRVKKDGANGIQLHVSYTKDNQNVVFHGPSLDDTICGSKEIITGFTLQELKDQCPFKNGDKILTLQEFLYQTKGLFHIYFLDINISDSITSSQQLSDAIAVVKELGLSEKVVFISSDDSINRIIKSDSTILGGISIPDFGTGKFITTAPQQFYLFSGNSIKKSTVETSKALKKSIIVYALNDYSILESAISLGIPYIMADNIPLVKKMIRSQLK